MLIVPRLRDPIFIRKFSQGKPVGKKEKKQRTDRRPRRVRRQAKSHREALKTVQSHLRAVLIRGEGAGVFIPPHRSVADCILPLFQYSMCR